MSSYICTDSKGINGISCFLVILGKWKSWVAPFGTIQMKTVDILPHSKQSRLLVYFFNQNNNSNNFLEMENMGFCERPKLGPVRDFANCV